MEEQLLPAFFFLCVKTTAGDITLTSLACVFQRNLTLFFLTAPSAGAIKTEAEESEETAQRPKAERREEELVLKEEAEGSEDGMEEGFEDRRTGDDEDGRNRDGGENGGDAGNEPQDLSLVDYSQYDGAALPGTHMVASAGADGTRGAPSRLQATGKLSCDICGLSCVSINVLLVHKRSHTGEYRNNKTPERKKKKKKRP